MILNFEPQFKGLILNGTKIHTVRIDQYKRWKPGMVIHFATGARTKLYNQFWYGHCKSIQTFTLERRIDKDGIVSSKVWIDGYQLTTTEIAELAFSDGLAISSVFMDFFIPRNYLVVLYRADQTAIHREISLTYCGRIIHWTSKRYGNEKTKR